MTAKVYKYVLISLMGLIFASAFMVSDELPNGIFTAKVFYFYLISAVVFVALVFILFSKRVIISINKLDIALLLFYGYSIVRLIFTENVPLYNERIICFTFLVIFYFVFKQIYLHEKGYVSYVLIFAFLTAGLLQGIIGLLQTYQILGYYHGKFIATGTFGNPAPYAQFIVSVLPFSMGLSQLINSNGLIDKLLKKYSLLTFLVCLLVLPSTETRGAWVASLSGVFFILAVKYRLDEKIKTILNKRWKKVTSVISAVLVIIILFTVLYQIRPSSAFGRLVRWKIASNIVADYPVFGIGYDSFDSQYNNYQASYFAEEERSDFEKWVVSDVKQAHNDFVETNVELGLVGLFLWLFIFYSVFINKRKNGSIRSLYYAAQASIIGLMISAMFTYPFQILPTLLNFIFLLSIVSSNLLPIKMISLSEKNNSKKIHFAFVAFALILIDSFIYKELNNYKAQLTWQKALNNSYIQNYVMAIKQYRSVYSDLKNNGNFLLNYGGALVLAGKYEDSILMLKKCEKINSESNLYILMGKSYEALGKKEEVKSAYMKASYMLPNLLYPKYLLAKFYMRAGEIIKAKSLALEIINTSPKIPSTAVLEMKNELGKMIKNLPK